MAKREKLDPADVAAALVETSGLVYLAADKLRVSAQTVYNYAKRHKAVQEAMEHQKGKRLDTAEGALWRAILDGQAWAVCFYLKTQGKSRGYVERQEIEQTATTRLVIEEDVVGDGHPPSPAAPGAG